VGRFEYDSGWSSFTSGGASSIFSATEDKNHTTESDTSTFSGGCIPPITSQRRRQITKTWELGYLWSN
jgi:hypothetical protein